MWLEEWVKGYRTAHQNYQIKHLQAEIDALSEHIEHCIQKRSHLRLERMRLEIELESGSKTLAGSGDE